MIKVGLLTINDYSNYGNRLQNYALQEVLIELGCSVNTIVQERSFLSEKSIRTPIQKIKSLMEVTNRKKIEQLKTKIDNIINKKYRQIKISNFKKFTIRYITEDSVKISINNVPEFIEDKYDYFITGSDQVWNPNLGFGNEIDFIEFAPKQKRIAYAPSFGISNIPEKFVDDYKIRLSNINKLSVREEDGAEIIKHLINKDVEVLVDPTLLIDKEKWLKIAREDKNKPKCKFVLTYILGNINGIEKSYIKKFAIQNNLEIVSLASYKYKSIYTIDPSVFIDYFNSAEIIMTNSFHGAAFAILMEKPFVVFDRDGMNSRTDTLLSKFKLKDKKFKHIIKYKNDVFKTDYSLVNTILISERLKAIKYLKEALNIDRNNYEN